MFILGFLSRYVNIHFLCGQTNFTLCQIANHSFVCKVRHLYLEKQVIDLKICAFGLRIVGGASPNFFPLSVYKSFLYDMSLNRYTNCGHNANKKIPN